MDTFNFMVFLSTYSIFYTTSLHPAEIPGQTKEQAALEAFFNSEKQPRIVPLKALLQSSPDLANHRWTIGEATANPLFISLMKNAESPIWETLFHSNADANIFLSPEQGTAAMQLASHEALFEFHRFELIFYTFLRYGIDFELKNSAGETVEDLLEQNYIHNSLWLEQSIGLLGLEQTQEILQGSVRSPEGSLANSNKQKQQLDAKYTQYRDACVRQKTLQAQILQDWQAGSCDRILEITGIPERGIGLLIANYAEPSLRDRADMIRDF